MASRPTMRVAKTNVGTAIPFIGLGTYAPPEGTQREDAHQWMTPALKAGYRHLDTAVMYGTEQAVGRAVKDCGILRDDIYITTKLAWNHHSRVREAIMDSLKKLGTHWVDLFLLHWPQCMENEGDDEFFPKHPDGSYKMTDKVNFIQVWEAMEEVHREAKCEAIGVSNFSVKNLQKLLESSRTRIVPVCNQVEMHPYLAQNELREYCQEKGIIMVAYAPTGYDTVRNDPVILDIAKKHNATPVQVIFAWHFARNTVVVTKSTKEDRQKEALAALDLKLDEGDMERINGLDRNERLCNKADENGKVWGWTYEQLGW